MMQLKTNGKTLWIVFVILLLLAIFLASWFSFSPYNTVKALLDNLASDGNLESFTLERYQSLRPIMIGFGIIAILKSLYLIISPIKSQQLIEKFIRWIGNIVKEFNGDKKEFFVLVKQYLKANNDWKTVGLIMFLGIILRAMMSDKPMGHDESYTYIAFASRDFIYVVSDYHLPNNHILHTIFVYLSTRLIGIQPWMIRLPAMIAGVLLIPTSYLAGRHYFNRPTGIVLSGITAIFPAFILMSTSARGYAQLSLISLLVWLLAGILKKRKNLFIWALFIVFSAAGFYTIPTMIYPFSAIMVWLFISWIMKDISMEYQKWGFFVFLIIAGLAVVGFTILLYTPVFFNTGVNSIVNNGVMGSLHVDTFKLFIEDFINRGARTWEQWHEELPTIFKSVLLIGFSASIFFHKKISHHKLNFFIVSFLVIFGLAAAQKTMGWVRIWFFYSPLYFAFATAGLIKLISLIPKFNEKTTQIFIKILLFIFILNTFTWMMGKSENMLQLQGKPAGNELASFYIGEVINESDAIITTISNGPAVWYYSKLNGVTFNHFDISNPAFTSAYVIVQTPSWNLESLLRDQIGNFDRIDIEDAELVHTMGNIDIYLVPIISVD